LLEIIRGCGTNFIAFLYSGTNFTAFFYNASVSGDGSAHIYIYIYIQTLAQNRTAVIKISCLTTLGNKEAEKWQKDWEGQGAFIMLVT